MTCLPDSPVDGQLEVMLLILSFVYINIIELFSVSIVLLYIKVEGKSSTLLLKQLNSF